MITNIPQSSVLLTYKGKILLITPDVNLETGVSVKPWSLIGGQTINKETSKQVIQRKIKSATKLDFENIELLPSKNKNRNFFYIELTDNQVNSIERRDNEKLEFFTLKELDKLNLNETTALLFNEYREEVEKIV